MGESTLKEHPPTLAAGQDDDGIGLALRQHFDADPEPADDGFTERLMAALPARAARRCGHWGERVVQLQWAALSIAAAVTALLVPLGSVQPDSTESIAAYTLIGLMAFWSIPSRWSRG